MDEPTLASARTLVAAEEGTPYWGDLVRIGMKREDDFCQLILWSRGRRFDGGLKVFSLAKKLSVSLFFDLEDPAIVKFAAAGDIKMVKALLKCGASVDSCSSWGHHGMLYDNKTALVVAASEY